MTAPRALPDAPVVAGWFLVISAGLVLGAGGMGVLLKWRTRA